ncbi:hypothetical protein BJ165DRAFT_235382 [Panaeolus papilionaceus]|nr:hypothetical protein BJ165DRAFT_235382 [Panaeolus papilionaceus]
MVVANCDLALVHHRVNLELHLQTRLLCAKTTHCENLNLSQDTILGQKILLVVSCLVMPTSLCPGSLKFVWNRPGSKQRLHLFIVLSPPPLLPCIFLLASRVCGHIRDILLDPYCANEGNMLTIPCLSTPHQHTYSLPCLSIITISSPYHMHRHHSPLTLQNGHIATDNEKDTASYSGC